jgi:peptidoglycan/LPS O-acetylase OafA/YrhL
MSVPEAEPRRPRVGVFDGLRGIAIVLVVLSHGWTIWPTSDLDESRLLLDLFGSGNYAVSIFFVVGSFLATSALLRKADKPSGLRPWVELTRRFIRLSGQVYFLLLVVALVTIFDSTDTYPDTETRTSVLRIGSYTWNWYVRDHAFSARPDLGHLWYLSVDMQVFVLILIVVYLLRRHPTWLLVTLGLILVSCWSWRTHVYETEPILEALLRTTVRMDAPLTGALAAAAVPYLRRFQQYARPVTAASALSLVPLLHFNRPAAGYFQWPGLCLDLALGLFMIGCTLAAPPRFVAAPLSLRPLTFLGRTSLSLYLWHYPVFWFVSRHTITWDWGWRTLMALAITFVTAVSSQTLVEGRVQKLLGSPSWHELEHDPPGFLGKRTRDLYASLTNR